MLTDTSRSCLSLSLEIHPRGTGFVIISTHRGSNNFNTPTRDMVCSPVPNVLMLPLSLIPTRNLADGVTYLVRRRVYLAINI